MPYPTPESFSVLKCNQMHSRSWKNPSKSCKHLQWRILTKHNYYKSVDFTILNMRRKNNLPGNTKTIVGHPADPENFFNSIQEFRFSWTDVNFGPYPEFWIVLTGINKRRTSSDCAVPHWGSNSIVIHRTHSGNVTWDEEDTLLRRVWFSFFFLF